MTERIIRSPRILQETSRGLEAYSVADDMFRHRELECVGEIDQDNAYDLCQQLRYLDRQEPGKEITLFIDSPGGSVSDGLAVYDTMKSIQSPVHTVCVSMAASMGAVLFAAGDRRTIMPHARVMIHDPLRTETGGSALKLQEESRQLMETRKIVCGILAACTGKNLKQIYNKTSKDSWFTAEEAVEFGLADDITQPAGKGAYER